MKDTEATVSEAELQAATEVIEEPRGRWPEPIDPSELRDTGKVVKEKAPIRGTPAVDGAKPVGASERTLVFESGTHPVSPAANPSTTTIPRQERQEALMSH
jgi:hypothetical protein